MKAEAAARESDSESHRRAITSLGTEVARGSRLSFELTVRNLRIFDPVQEVTWQGHIDCVQFEVEVPTDANPGAVVATVTASQDSVPIGNLRFKLLLVDGVCKSRQEPRGMATRYDLAFISYASADRLEVLRRIQVLSAVGRGQEIQTGSRWSGDML
jgi:hypothetical protein